VIEFFNSKGIRDITQFGETAYNTIAEEDVARYLNNRVNDSKAFEKFIHVLLRN